MPFSAHLMTLSNACSHSISSFILAVACMVGISDTALARPMVDPVDGPHVDLKLSLEPDALRMQVTMNIVFLDEAPEFERELADRIDPAEGPALLEALQRWADVDRRVRRSRPWRRCPSSRRAPRRPRRPARS